MSAIGNQQQPPGGNVGQSIQQTLGVASVLGEPASMFTRKGATVGYRLRGIVSFGTMFLPALIDGARRDHYGRPAAGGVGFYLSAALLALWVISKLASASNRLVLHSCELGISRFRRVLSPATELAVGMLVAAGIAQLDDAMGGFMAISAFCNFVAVRAVQERQRKEAEAAFDQLKRGEVLGRGMGNW